MVAWVGAGRRAPSPAGAWRREGTWRGLKHRVPSPSPHLHVHRAGNFPFFSVSKELNFLHSDLRPHPGWGTRGRCQMSLLCPALHRWAGDQSLSVGRQQRCLGCGQPEGAKTRGLDPAPSTHALRAQCTTSRQTAPASQPPQHVPQGGQGATVPSHPRAGSQPSLAIGGVGAQAVLAAHPGASPRH